MWPFSKKKRPKKYKAIKPPPVMGLSPSGSDLFDGGLESFTGDKFFSGFGATKIYRHGAIDYWTLRDRSLQLYVENEYAQGLIDRLVTNVINTGLKLNATPEQDILGLTDEENQVWTDDIEQRFALFTEDKTLVDWVKLQPFSQLQAVAKLLAFLSGDVLVVLHVTNKTKLPQIQLIDGALVRSPIKSVSDNKIIDGVEIDKQGRHVAYWVVTRPHVAKGFTPTKMVRIPAKGVKSGRQIAWLLYGSKKLANETRGLPLLSCCLQALKEIDRYKDSELRAAWVNSIFALSIQRESEESIPSTSPLGRAAVRSGEVEATNQDGTTTTTPIGYQLPGIMIDTLQPGEKLVSHDSSRPNTNFKDFARAILAGIAWSQGLPPEILFLEFANNFSASRQASIEFKTWLDQARLHFSTQFNTPYYIEWLTLYALQGKVIMEGYIQALRDPTKWEIRNAWRKQKWLGAARPSVDLLKEIKSWVAMVDAKFASREEATQELRGSDFTQTLRRLKAEDEKIGDIPEPLDTNNDDIKDNIEDIRSLLNG